jgi:penicillin amidase
MRKWIWLIVLALWLLLLFIPWEGVPPLNKFLLYPNSVLQVEMGDESKTFTSSPHPGLNISYDERGVPHIFAEDEIELAFGMGITHAKDRQFQLEMLTRTVRGRLSEVVGEDGLESDRWWVKFDFEAKSAEAYQKLKEEDSEIAAIFKAYADGYNYFIEQQTSAEKAPEFHLLGFKPSKMKPYAPILLIRYMDKVLNYSENDLKFSALKKYLSQDLINYYYPMQSDYAFPIYPELSIIDTLNQQIGVIPYTAKSDFASAQTRRAGNNEVGSNNWAIAAEKSATGNSFLCNDTHLPLDLPGTWYEVHQVVNGKVCHGMSIPGSPMVISGFTNKVAWGMTNATWDLTEFYRLETNQQNQYKLDGEWLYLEATTVSIPIKGQEDFDFTFFNSYFGPTDNMGEDILATQWVGDNFDLSEMRAFLDIRNSTTIKEAHTALMNFGHPAQNFVLSDHNGDIGMVTAGYALLHTRPQRGISLGTRKSNKAKFTHLGRRLVVLNPNKGWNQSANAQQVTSEFTPFLNSLFAPTARGRRISKMLLAEDKIDRDYLKKMQGDVIDGEWHLLKPIILESAPESFLPYLKNWDGSCNVESKAATIYSVFKKALSDTISKRLLDRFDFEPQQEQLLYLVYNKRPLPLPSGSSIDYSELVQSVWAGTINYLGDYYGFNPKLWEYGKYHQIYFRHLTKLRPFNYQAFPAKGSPRTINVSSNLPGTHGPSMRTLIELRRNQEPIAEMVLAGGQSGIPSHKHYTDQIKPWYNLEYYRIDWVRNDTDRKWDVQYNFK